MRTSWGTVVCVGLGSTSWGNAAALGVAARSEHNGTFFPSAAALPHSLLHSFAGYSSVTKYVAEEIHFDIE